MNLPKSRFVLALLTAMLVAGLLNITVAPAAAAAADKQAIKVEVDNRLLAFDVSPFIEKGRVLVPARALFEALGASIEWDGKTKTVTAIKGDTVVKLTIGSKIASITQRGVTQVILDAPAKIVNGRTMVPLRLISEAFGAKVAWDDQSRLVKVATGVPAKEELVVALASYGTTPLPPDGLGVHNLVHVYEPLIFLNDKFELQPGLITSWERVDDLTWRFKLRRGVKFHNGKEFDAEAAAFSIAHWLDSSVAYLKGRVSQMVNADSFQVKDKYALEVKTIKPCPQFPSFLTHNAVVAVEPGAFKNGEIVGTGPFKLLEIVKDQYVSVERFDDYWGKKPFFKRIVFKIVPDANTPKIEGLDNIEIINARWEELQDREIASYDVVVAAYSFSMPDIKNALQMMFDHTKGILFLVTSAENGFTGIYQEVFDNAEFFTDNYIYLYNILHQMDIQANVHIITRKFIHPWDLMLSLLKLQLDLNPELEIRLFEELKRKERFFENNGKLWVKSWHKDALIWHLKETS